MRFARSFARFYSSGSNIEHRTKALQILSAAAKELKSNEKGCILGWSAKLLGSVDRASHGIDLLGRDSYLLGCLLCTMGNFMESCAGTMDALYLGAAVIKLVLSDSVVANMKREAFVLRSGLAAAARAISSVPAASIATSVANDMLTVESFVTDTGKAQTSGAAAAIELEKARQRRHTDVALDHGQRRRVQRHIIVRHSFFENSHVVILVRGLDPVKAV